MFNNKEIDELKTRMKTVELELRELRQNDLRNLRGDLTIQAYEKLPYNYIFSSNTKSKQISVKEAINKIISHLGLAFEYQKGKEASVELCKHEKDKGEA